MKTILLLAALTFSTSIMAQTDISEDYVEIGEPTEEQVKSVTEDIINDDFIDEATMQGDLLQMLANFATYLKNDFQVAQAPNSEGELCG